MRICIDNQNSYTQKHNYILYPIYTNTSSVLSPKFDKEFFMKWTRDQRLRKCKMNDFDKTHLLFLPILFLLIFQQFSSDCHLPLMSNVHTGFNDKNCRKKHSEATMVRQHVKESIKVLCQTALGSDVCSITR